MKKSTIFILFFILISTFSFAQYTLQNSDVVVTNGQIISCNITDFNTASYSMGDIIIPVILDGDTIKGIADGTSFNNGIFYNRGITKLSLPSSIQTIGNYAFDNNSISKLDLSICTSLLSIGDKAFYDNSIDTFDISTCTVLQSIGYYTFRGNNISHLDLTVCTSILYIGDGAFKSNSISSLDLSACTALQYIGNSAFYENSISTINLSTNTDLQYIGVYAFYANSIISLDLNACIYLQTIGDYAFQSNSIDTLNLNGCTTLQTIGARAFYNNSIDTLSLNGCTNLQSIGERAFYTNNISSFILPTPIIIGYSFTNWEDQNTNTYSGGTAVSDLFTSYTANLLATGSQVSFTINNAITNTEIQNAVIDLGIYGTRISNFYGIAIFESVNDTNNLTYTVSKDGYSTNGNITISGNSISENVLLCQAYTNYDTLVILKSELPYSYNTEVIPIGTPSGDITYTYSSINGCDSVVALNLTINLDIGLKDAENGIVCVIYPNPTSSICNLSLNLEESQEVIIRLINNLGQEMEYRKLNSAKEFNETFDFSEMASGIYSILINVDGKQITKRVVVN